MSIPEFEFTRATTVSQACALLADPAQGSELLAGGTQLLFAMKNRTHTPQRLVDIGTIPGLDTITFSAADGLLIGARVTLAHLADHADVHGRYPAVAEAARLVGTPQLQSMGTVAGNLCQDSCCLYIDRAVEQRQALSPCLKLHGDVCHVVANSDLCYANYAGDLAPVLIALGASVTVASSSGQEMRPLPALFSGEGKRPIALAAGELVTSVRVPPPAPRSGAVYLKMRQRQSLDYPLLGAAAAVALDAHGLCTRASVVLTGVDRGPVVVEEAGSLEGQPPTDAAVAVVAHAAYRRARPVKNAFGYGPSYRVKMVKPFVEQALRGALARAEGREVGRG